MSEERGSAPFVFVGGLMCLDFVNTQLVKEGRLVDLLGGFADLVSWLVQAQALEAKLAREALRRWDAQPEGERTFEEARALRTTLRGMVDQIVQRRPVPPSAVEHLNSLLRHRRGYPQLVRVRGRLEPRFAWEFQEAIQLLAPIAESAGDLLCHHDLALVKKCDNPACVLYFYDSTKNHARRWCSMQVCGNRMKVATHYRRIRRQRTT